MNRVISKWKKECEKFFDENVRGTAILDIGCGKYPHPKATLTLDIDGEYNPNFIADVQRHIPLPDASVDCIIMNNTLEHLHTPLQALAECHRVLCKGGVLLVAVPFLIKLHQEPIDYHRYTIHMLKRLFGSFEYTVVSSPQTLKDYYEIVQRDLFGLLSRRQYPIAFIAAIAIRGLTRLIPSLQEKSYPAGYFVVAKKRE